MTESQMLAVPDEDRIKKALELALRYGGTDGDHHKAWVIDQMVRALTGDAYETWVRAACAGSDEMERLERQVADLKRRIRLARARLSESHAPPTASPHAAWLRDVYALLDLRRPLQRRRR